MVINYISIFKKAKMTTTTKHLDTEMLLCCYDPQALEYTKPTGGDY